uniref:Uncharacterized protein n=1 Tax=Arundo donax TaxID=35708 RepID=A0A0A9ETE5_ARUDO
MKQVLYKAMGRKGSWELARWRCWLSNLSWVGSCML